MISSVYPITMPVAEFYERAHLPLLRKKRYPRPEHADRLAMTDEAYRQTIRRLDEFAEAHQRAPAATLIDVSNEGWLDEYKHWRAQQVKLATVNKDVRYIRALNRSACRFKVIAEPPDIETFEEDVDDAEAYSVEEISALLAAAHDTPGSICEIPAANWWMSLLLALFDTGVRIRAILGTEWAALDADRGVIRFPARLQKQRKAQTKTLHVDTLRMVRAIAEPARPLIWPWPWHRTTLYKRLHEIVARAHVSPKRKPIHALRASHATYATEVAGEQVASDSLGHSTIKLTRKHYIVSTMLSQPRLVDLLPRPTLPASVVSRQKWLF